jgi:hypothetical protein
MYIIHTKTEILIFLLDNKLFSRYYVAIVELLYFVLSIFDILCKDFR